MARVFNGSNQRVFNNTSGISGVTQMTVACHAYATGDGQGPGFPALINSDADSGFMRWRLKPQFADGARQWALLALSTGGNFQWLTNATTFPHNQWLHFAFTMDWGSVANDPVLYTGGVESASTENLTGSGTFANDGNRLSIGGNQALDRCFAGYGAEVGIWERILSPDEIAFLGKGFSPKFLPNGLIIYAPLLGNDSPEPEYARGSNFTLTNSPTKVSHPRIIYPSSGFIVPTGSVVEPSTAPDGYISSMGGYI